MTTGRINQVTILTLEPGGSSVNSRRSRAVTERRKELESLTAVERTLERGYTGLSHYPFAPTEFPTGRSATQESELESILSVTCTPQEEDTIHESRPGTGTRSGLPPNVLGIGLTIGH